MDKKEFANCEEQDIELMEQSIQSDVEEELTITDEESEQVTENEKRPDHKNKSNHGFLKELILYVVLFLVCIFIIPQYVVQRTIVDQTSMENTLHSGDNLIVEKVSYRFKNPERFDIIIFHPVATDENEFYVKRVIGLPGETIQIKDNKIYINEKELKENYGKNSIIDPGIAKDPITLGDDEFFVMGDNRDVSLDSRSPEVGLVKKDSIQAKAIFRIWPLSEIGTLQ